MEGGEVSANLKESIPKGKQDEAELPKARPICLIDDIGKYLERIIGVRPSCA